MWPFDQPENCATIVSKSILNRENPILLVVHEAEDESWLFLDGQPFEPDLAAIVALRRVIEIDPSMQDLAFLKPGWQAFRNSVSTEWAIKRVPEEAE